MGKCKFLHVFWVQSALLFLTFVFTDIIYAADAISRETKSTTTLRVCADPANLPFSNKKEEGFENKIISLIAKELDMALQYTWFPQTIGYVRNTLQAHQCDLISGITTTSERVQNTNPYYHSVYALVYKKESGPLPTDFSDAVYKNITIGVIAGTPATNLLAKYGLLSNIKPYHLAVDTRYFSSGKQAIKDVDAGITDAAIIWGPIAGYFAQQASQELMVIPLVEESKSLPLNFSITMAVRYNDQEWKQEINQILKNIEPKIISILKGYNVPLINNLGQLRQD